MKFKEKIVICEQHEVYKKAMELQENWISALLVKMRIDIEKINSMRNDPNFSKRAWRKHLFYDNGIEIIKYKDKIVISKYFAEKPSIVLGEWQDPEIVRVKKDGKTKCELHLKYWPKV